MSARVEAWVVRVLRGLPHISDIEEAPANSRADLILRIEGHEPLRIELKRHVDAARAHQVAAQAGRGDPTPLLVVAETMTATARAFLRDHDIGYIDGEGNASIDLPGYVVRAGAFTADAVIAPRRAGTIRLSAKAGLVAQVLLLEPERLWRVKDAASVAGVSAGLAHRTLARLESQGLLAAEGAGPSKVRHLLQPAALLDLWAEEDTERRVIRTASYLLVPTRSRVRTVASERLERAGIVHGITGVAAAIRWAPVLTSVPVTQVRCTASISADMALRALDARQVEDGANLVLIQSEDDTELRLRREIDQTWFAANTRIYLDALRDSRRGKEQADAFRTSVFGF